MTPSSRLGFPVAKKNGSRRRRRPARGAAPAAPSAWPRAPLAGDPPASSMRRPVPSFVFQTGHREEGVFPETFSRKPFARAFARARLPRLRTRKIPENRTPPRLSAPPRPTTPSPASAASVPRPRRSRATSRASSAKAQRRARARGGNQRPDRRRVARVARLAPERRLDAVSNVFFVSTEPRPSLFSSFSIHRAVFRRRARGDDVSRARRLAVPPEPPPHRTHLVAKRAPTGVAERESSRRGDAEFFLRRQPRLNASRDFCFVHLEQKRVAMMLRSSFLYLQKRLLGGVQTPPRDDRRVRFSDAKTTISASTLSRYAARRVARSRQVTNARRARTRSGQPRRSVSASSWSVKKIADSVTSTQPRKKTRRVRARAPPRLRGRVRGRGRRRGATRLYVSLNAFCSRLFASPPPRRRSGGARVGPPVRANAPSPSPTPSSRKTPSTPNASRASRTPKNERRRTRAPSFRTATSRTPAARARRPQRPWTRACARGKKP